MEDRNKEVGKILKTARNNLGYSLEDIKNILKRDHNIELDTSNISRYENGTVKNMNAEYLRAICQINGVDYIDIFQKLGYLQAGVALKGYQLDSRGRRQLKDLMTETALMFDDENISLEDKEKMLLAIQEAFYDAKLKNKRKK